MSNKMYILLTGLMLISLASFSFAQGGGKGMMQELGLTEEQTKQVREIMQEQRTLAREWQKKHQEETESKLSEVLDDDQMEKLQSMQKRGRNKNQRSRNNKPPY